MDKKTEEEKLFFSNHLPSDSSMLLFAPHQPQGSRHYFFLASAGDVMHFDLLIDSPKVSWSLRYTRGFPGGISGKELACQCRRCKRHGFDPWVRKIPSRRPWQPTPVFLPEESHGQRGLVSYSLWGCKESDTTKQLTHTQCVYVNPKLLIYPCPQSFWFLKTHFGGFFFFF